MTKKHKKAIIRHIPISSIQPPVPLPVPSVEPVPAQDHTTLENSFIESTAEPGTLVEASHQNDDDDEIKNNAEEAEEEEPLTPENSAKLYNWIVYQLVQQNQELKNTINEQNREFKETFLEQNQKYKDIIIEKNRIITDLVNKLEIIVSNSNLLGLIPKD